MKQNKTHYWDNKRHCIESHRGKWSKEDVTICGFSLLQDLLGKVSYMQVIILNATGRLVDKNIADWFEANFIGMSYPDSRIWCNQVGALAGQTKTSPIAATVAGVLSADSRLFGAQTNEAGMKLISQALKLYQQQFSLSEIVQRVAKIKHGKPVLVGYARPISASDERIEPHERVRKRLGFELGPHLKLAFKLGDYLDSHHGMGLNISGYASAFLRDQNFTPSEVYRIKAMSVASGITAAYTDGYSEPVYSYLPLKCSDIEYIGPVNRVIKE